jgi:hypothetical protein
VVADVAAVVADREAGPSTRVIVVAATVHSHR